MMKKTIELQKMIYPDLLISMESRFKILYTIFLFQPIGRRGIVESTGFTERYIRNEIDLLHTQNLIKVTIQGVYITDEGKLIINNLEDFIRELSGMTTLENNLREVLEIEHIIIVTGNSDKELFVKDELGRATVSFLEQIIKEREVIAVTGGTTMASVAKAMVPLYKDKCLFVPARGGVGSIVEYQANTIVAEMAKKENGEYALLHVPDPMSEDLYKTIVKEPSIIDVLSKIKQANIVLHGVGNALDMAKRRQTEPLIYNKLKKNQAIAEAFGYYFNKSGEVVHKVRTLGLQLDDLNSTDYVVTVAGGKLKAEAISAFMQQRKSNVLITDEAAALEILNLKEKMKMQ